MFVAGTTYQSSFQDLAFKLVLEQKVGKDSERRKRQRDAHGRYNPFGVIFLVFDVFALGKVINDTDQRDSRKRGDTEPVAVAAHG